MNIKELKEYIKDLPDDMEVAITDPEGGYKPVGNISVEELGGIKGELKNYLILE